MHRLDKYLCGVCVFMLNPSILIVGAGPTGMTTAIESKRAGFDVRIIDKRDGLAEHSQALAVQARTLEQFQRYGIADQAVARGRKLRGARFYSEGKQIVAITFDQLPSRYPVPSVSAPIRNRGAAECPHGEPGSENGTPPGTGVARPA